MRSSSVPLALLLALSALLPVRGAEPSAPSPVPIDAEAAKTLKAVDTFYSDLQSFQVEVYTSSLSMIARAVTPREIYSTVLVSRPASLSIVERSRILKKPLNPNAADTPLRPFDENRLVSNGQNLEIHTSAARIQLSTQAPGDFAGLLSPSQLDRKLAAGALEATGIVRHFVLPDDWQNFSRHKTVTYVGREPLPAGAADHLRFAWRNATSESVDDVWFAAGESPVLLQWNHTMQALFLPGTLKEPLPKDWKAPYWEDARTFSNWRWNQPIPAESFVYRPPPPPTETEVVGKTAPTAPLDPVAQAARNEAYLKALKEEEAVVMESANLLQLWASQKKKSPAKE